MKRRDLIRHVEAHGGEFLREGGNHTVYVNRKEKKAATIPRHREIENILHGRYAKTWEFRSPDAQFRQAVLHG